MTGGTWAVVSVFVLIWLVGNAVERVREWIEVRRVLVCDSCRQRHAVVYRILDGEPFAVCVECVV